MEEVVVNESGTKVSGGPIAARRAFFEKSAKTRQSKIPPPKAYGTPGRKSLNEHVQRSEESVRKGEPTSFAMESEDRNEMEERVMQLTTNVSELRDRWGTLSAKKSTPCPSWKRTYNLIPFPVDQSPTLGNPAFILEKKSATGAKEDPLKTAGGEDPLSEAREEEPDEDICILKVESPEFGQLEMPAETEEQPCQEEVLEEEATLPSEILPSKDKKEEKAITQTTKPSGKSKTTSCSDDTQMTKSEQKNIHDDRENKFTTQTKTLPEANEPKDSCMDNAALDDDNDDLERKPIAKPDEKIGQRATISEVESEKDELESLDSMEQHRSTQDEDDEEQTGAKKYDSSVFEWFAEKPHHTPIGEPFCSSLEQAEPPKDVSVARETGETDGSGKDQETRLHKDSAGMCDNIRTESSGGKEAHVLLNVGEEEEGYSKDVEEKEDKEMPSVVGSGDNKAHIYVESPRDPPVVRDNVPLPQVGAEKKYNDNAPSPQIGEETTDTNKVGEDMTDTNKADTNKADTNMVGEETTDTNKVGLETTDNKETCVNVDSQKKSPVALDIGDDKKKTIEANVETSGADNLDREGKSPKKAPVAQKVGKDKAINTGSSDIILEPEAQTTIKDNVLPAGASRTTRAIREWRALNVDLDVDKGVLECSPTEKNGTSKEQHSKEEKPRSASQTQGSATTTQGFTEIPVVLGEEMAETTETPLVIGQDVGTSDYGNCLSVIGALVQPNLTPRSNAETMMKPNKEKDSVKSVNEPSNSAKKEPSDSAHAPSPIGKMARGENVQDSSTVSAYQKARRFSQLVAKKESPRFKTAQRHTQDVGDRVTVKKAPTSSENSPHQNPDENKEEFDDGTKVNFSGPDQKHAESNKRTITRGLEIKTFYNKKPTSLSSDTQNKEPLSFITQATEIAKDSVEKKSIEGVRSPVSNHQERPEGTALNKVRPTVTSNIGSTEDSPVQTEIESAEDDPFDLRNGGSEDQEAQPEDLARVVADDPFDLRNGGSEEEEAQPEELARVVARKEEAEEQLARLEEIIADTRDEAEAEQLAKLEKMIVGTTEQEYLKQLGEDQADIYEDKSFQEVYGDLIANVEPTADERSKSLASVVDTEGELAVDRADTEGALAVDREHLMHTSPTELEIAGETNVRSKEYSVQVPELEPRPKELPLPAKAETNQDVAKTYVSPRGPPIPASPAKGEAKEDVAETKVRPKEPLMPAFNVRPRRPPMQIKQDVLETNPVEVEVKQDASETKPKPAAPTGMPRHTDSQMEHPRKSSTAEAEIRVELSTVSANRMGEQLSHYQMQKEMAEHDFLEMDGSKTTTTDKVPTSGSCGNRQPLQSSEMTLHARRTAQKLRAAKDLMRPYIPNNGGEVGPAESFVQRAMRKLDQDNTGDAPYKHFIAEKNDTDTSDTIEISKSTESNADEPCVVNIQGGALGKDTKGLLSAEIKAEMEKDTKCPLLVEQEGALKQTYSATPTNIESAAKEENKCLLQVDQEGALKQTHSPTQTNIESETKEEKKCFVMEEKKFPVPAPELLMHLEPLQPDLQPETATLVDVVGQATTQPDMAMLVEVPLETCTEKKHEGLPVAQANTSAEAEARVPEEWKGNKEQGSDNKQEVYASCNAACYLIEDVPALILSPTKVQKYMEAYEADSVSFVSLLDKYKNPDRERSVTKKPSVDSVERVQKKVSGDSVELVQKRFSDEMLPHVEFSQDEQDLCRHIVSADQARCLEQCSIM